MANNVTWIRPELANMMPQYCLIKDCIDGEFAVKGIVQAGVMANYSAPSAAAYGGAGSSISGLSRPKINLSLAKRYLPMPNERDDSPENRDRYEQYIIRAIFYGATGRTLDGMTGQVFQRDPVFDIPDSIKQTIIDNADGSGVGLLQLAMRAVRYALPYGRLGIFVDYPTTNGPTTQAQVDSGDIRPVIRLFAPWDVINWRCKQKGARYVFDLVVLRELYNIYEDDASENFESKMMYRYRVLRLDATGLYVQELWEPKINPTSRITKASDYQYEAITVKDANGNQMTDIPFMFVGAENNDEYIDNPPMYDIASINIGHYRNSADYEESCHITGQPTLAISGLTEDWVKNVLKDSIQMGARTAIPLPPNASIEMVQPDPNTMPKEAMELKERQMVALGAKLVQQTTVQRTATESVMEGSSDSSILANVARNVSTAFEWALKMCLKFVSKGKTDSTAVKFQLNTQFDLAQMSADDQSKLIAAWQKGAITFGEMRAKLKLAGTATLDDDKALSAIAEEQSVLTAAGVLADPFGAVPGQSSAPNFDPLNPPNADPNKSPAKHAVQPKTRGQNA